MTRRLVSYLKEKYTGSEAGFDPVYSCLEVNYFGIPVKGGEGGLCVAEIQHAGVVIVLVISTTQVGVCVQHGLLSLHAVVIDQFAGDADPGAVVETADLHLGILHQLLVDRLVLASLDIQLILENVDGAKGTHPGLIALHRCQIEGIGLLQKFTNSNHMLPPLTHWVRLI